MILRRWIIIIIIMIILTDRSLWFEESFACLSIMGLLGDVNFDCQNERDNFNETMKKLRNR